jgi:hypothetical protein
MPLKLSEAAAVVEIRSLLPVVTGHCLCGGVRFRIDAELRNARYCHCTRCQRRTGTGASASAGFPGSALTVLAGEELIKAYAPERGFAKLFCSECGSALFSRSQDDPEVMAVRLGVLDGDPGVRPTKRQFVAYAAAWEPIPDDGLERFEEGAR